MNGRIDVGDWGAVVDSGSPEELLQTNLEDGVYEVVFGTNILYMKISNTRFLDSHQSLLVCLNAAISSRSDKTPPYFSGEGIAASLQSCLISISDPSTHIDGVDLGWYIGNEEWFSLQADLCALLDRLSAHFSKRLVFFGGSGGGFASFAISLGLTVPSTIIGMNPQLDITLYPTANVFATKAFPSMEISTKENFVENRDAWVNFFQSQGLVTKVTKDLLNPLCDYVLLQNWNDTHHLRLHTPFLMPNIAELSLSNWFGHTDDFGYVIGPWGDRHTVVWKEHILLCLSMALDGQLSREIIQAVANEFLPRSANKSQNKSQLSFPPIHPIGSNKAPLNLVRFDRAFFEKHNIEENIFDLSFLQNYLVASQTNLDIYAVLWGLQCWFSMTKPYLETEEEGWKKVDLESLANILGAISNEFKQRKALNHHREFLIEFVSCVIEATEQNGYPINAALWSEIITFHSILSNSE